MISFFLFKIYFTKSNIKPRYLNNNFLNFLGVESLISKTGGFIVSPVSTAVPNPQNRPKTNPSVVSTTPAVATVIPATTITTVTTVPPLPTRTVIAIVTTVIIPVPTTTIATVTVTTTGAAGSAGPATPPASPPAGAAATGTSPSILTGALPLPAAGRGRAAPGGIRAAAGRARDPPSRPRPRRGRAHARTPR